MTDSPIEPARKGAEGGNPRSDIVAGIFLAAISLFALLWLIPQNTLPSANPHDIPPAFFPALAAWAVLALSVLLIGIRLRRHRPAAGIEDGPAILKEMAVWAIVGGITVLGLRSLGFMATAALLIAVWMLVGGRRTWWQVLLLATLFPLAVEQLAWIVFTVRLPA